MAEKQTATLFAPDINCGHCQQHITNDLGKYPGIGKVSASPQTKIVEVEYDQEVVLRMVVQVHEDIAGDLAHGYHIRDANGVDVVYSDSLIEQTNIAEPRAGERYVIEWSFKAALQHGKYSVAAGMSVPINMLLSQVDRCDWVPLAAQFVVAPRRESYMYGSVHLDNLVRVRRIGAADVQRGERQGG